MGLNKLNNYVFSLFLLLLAAGCDSASKSWSSVAFHNTTAHYNGYYYARHEIRDIEAQIAKSRKDDYNRILRLYPSLDSTLAKSYDKQAQEAIKMASLAIQRHPNSKWVDDSYILVGKARLYSLDWGNAIQTFKFVNTKSEDKNARHLAIINLARTFTEHQEYSNAEAAFEFLSKEKLSKENEKRFYLEQAHYYQIREDYDKMVRNLSAAAPFLKKKDKPGRILFILGQLYQRLGFESEAFNYYRACIGTNPDYEIDFYARLYMAQVAEISKSRNIANARKSFKKLLKDSKNKEFKDKIYYEMGVFERKQGNLTEAIDNFNLSLRTGKSSQVHGEAYLRLGEIYYDTLRKFELSQAYYDSAVKSLPTDYENYSKIKERQTILNEFVQNLKTIEWQDSLLIMSTMDTAVLRENIAAYIESQKPPEVKGKRKKRNRVNIATVDTSLGGVEQLGNSTWYFGNPSAVVLGQSEFQRVWGTIPLEDNWRRSSRTAIRTNNPQTQEQDNLALAGNSSNSENAVIRDPVQEEFDRIYAQLPFKEDQKQESLGKIEEAYFRLGDIYYFDLEEKDNAVKSFTTLMSRFPESEHEPEVLYKLYLIFKDIEPQKAEPYASRLKREFPNSTYAKVLINPDYLRESGQIVEQQKALYAQAYKLYQEGSYDASDELLNKGIAMETTSFSPTMKLLKILIVGETENITQYQYQLDQFIKNNPGIEASAYAQTLLQSSREYQLRLETQNGVNYVRSFEEPHMFAIVYVNESNLQAQATLFLEQFNRASFNDLGLTVSNLMLDDKQSITLVSDLPRVSTAIEYYRTFTEKARNSPLFKSHKFDTFVITKDNFDIFYRTKGLNEYVEFFEKNYHPEDP